MKSIVKTIECETTAPIQVINITDRVKSILEESGIQEGSLTLLTQHTTTAININEEEEGLQRDMIDFLKHFVPADGDYVHNRNAADGRPNAHSHLMTLLTNSSETIPITQGKMLLGDWQSLFFIELDGPRPKRTVTIHIYG